MRLTLSLMAACGFVLTGCATAPDPAEVCTAEWIQPRAQRAVDAIEKDTRSLVKSLNRASKSYSEGKKPGPLDMFRLSNAVDRLTKELKSGRGIKDLRVLRDTCNDPEIITDSLTSFMEDQGLPSRVIDFIQGLRAYQDLISTESAVKT